MNASMGVRAHGDFSAGGFVFRSGARDHQTEPLNPAGVSSAGPACTQRSRSAISCGVSAGPDLGMRGVVPLTAGTSRAEAARTPAKVVNWIPAAGF